MSESIKARFWVTKSTVTIFALYHDVSLTIRWKRGEDAVRHVRTMVSNLSEMVDEGLNEVLVQDALNRLDFDIESLFTEHDEDRPDDK